MNSKKGKREWEQNSKLKVCIKDDIENEDYISEKTTNSAPQKFDKDTFLKGLKKYLEEDMEI